MIVEDSSIKTTVEDSSIETTVEDSSTKTVVVEHKKNELELGKIKSTNKSLWGINWLPSGFELTSVQLTTRDSHRTHWTYSDGLATLSVFVEQELDKKPVTARSYVRGDTLIYDVSLANTRITVLGSISAKAADKIARSVYKLKSVF